MNNETVTINSRKYDGKINRSWKARLIEQKGSKLLFVGEFEREVIHEDLGIIRRGTISYEYYWLNRWYNIFRFHEPNGDFRNFYCNINMPPTFRNGVLDYVDLDIDVIISKQSDFTILDRDEYEENLRFFDYPESVQITVEKTIAKLKEMFALGEYPFDSKRIEIQGSQ